MVRQGNDSHAGLAFIPSRLECFEDERLELGFQILFTG